jgi:Protein of unknown function (DUF2948)
MTDRTRSEDARFEDAGGIPLRLSAEAPGDIPVLSALVQDSVTGRADMAWMAKRHRFTILLNRFRWEDHGAAERQGRPFERVRSLLSIEGVLKVRSEGIDPADRDSVLSLLSLVFEPGEEGAGTLRLVFAGDGEVALDVECVDLKLADVTRPYIAQASTAPHHPTD